jgi:hypothetical protein
MINSHTIELLMVWIKNEQQHFYFANTNKTLLLTILEVINRMIDELPLRQNAHHILNYIPY